MDVVNILICMNFRCIYCGPFEKVWCKTVDSDNYVYFYFQKFDDLSDLIEIERDRIVATEKNKYPIGGVIVFLGEIYLIIDNYENRDFCGKIQSFDEVIDKFYFNKFINTLSGSWKETLFQYEEKIFPVEIWKR